MAFSKVNPSNYKPGPGDDRFPVYSKQLNEALNKLNGVGTPEPISSLQNQTTVAPVGEAESTTLSISVSNSGGTTFVGPVSSTLILNLPANPPNGTNFTFKLIAAEADATITAPAGIIYAGYVIDGAGTSNEPGEGQTIRFAGASGASSIGDTIKLQMYEGIWYVEAFCLTPDGITFPE